MSNFHKHFLQYIFDELGGVESDEVGGSHFDMSSFGEKIALAKVPTLTPWPSLNDVMTTMACR